MERLHEQIKEENLDCMLSCCKDTCEEKNSRTTKKFYWMLHWQTYILVIPGEDGITKYGISYEG